MAIGRISGPLLKANLVRDGADLAFETDLLYLDVNNQRIGIKNASPTTTLDVTGTTRTTTLTVDTQMDVGVLTFTNNTISSSLDTISFQPAGGDPTVYNARLQVDSFEITNNSISTIVSNANIEIRPNGSGTVELQATTNVTGDVTVSGNMDVQGDVTIGGNITIGDAFTDNIQFNAKIVSDIIPDGNGIYDLGSPTFRWNTVYVTDLFADAINVPTLDIGDLRFRDNIISTTSGLDMYLDGNGTGGVAFGNFLITDNLITNIANNAITQIAQTGTGYFKIATTNGFVPPRGTNAQRPTAYAVLGMTRYNTDSKALEVWDGAAWSSPAGASGAVSEIVANDIAASFALILG
jgi:hypothetical protein